MKKILTILICLGAGNHMFGQSLLSSSGNHYENSGIQLSYSLGETVIATYSEPGISLTQGFHQGADYSLSTSTEKQLELLVYPNPCVDRLHIQPAEPGIHRLALYDMSGRLLKRARQYMDSPYVLNMNGLAPGMYLLQLISEQGERSASLPVQKMH